MVKFTSPYHARIAADLQHSDAGQAVTVTASTALTQTAREPQLRDSKRR